MRWAVPIVVLLSVTLRLGYLHEIGDSPLFVSPVLEAGDYLEDARRLPDASSTSLLEQGRSPLYTHLLALAAPLGASIWGLHLLQALAGTVTCVLVWLIGRQLFPLHVALSAALGTAAYGPLLFYTGELLPVTISALFVLFPIWLLLPQSTAPPSWRLLAAGLSAALAGLLTPAALLLLPFLLCWVGWHRGWRDGLWFVAGCTVVLIPMGSWLVGGDLAPDAGGSLGANLQLFWRGEESSYDLSPYVVYRDSFLLSVLVWNQGVAFPFGLLAPLALVGMALSLRDADRASPQRQLLLGFVVSFALAAILFAVDGRSRVPVIPVLLLFAANGIWAVAGGRHRLASLLAVAVLLLTLNAGAGPLPAPGLTHGHLWRGLSYEHQGMSANAMREYRQALRLDPNLPGALLNLAGIVSLRGDDIEAESLYRRYLDGDPASIPARRGLAMALMGDGRSVAALQELEQLVTAAPERADLHGSLAFVSLVAGRPDRATIAYRRVLSLRPDSVLVRYQLARLHSSQGHVDSATTQYLLVLDQDPEHAETQQALADLLIDRAGGPEAGVQLEMTPELAQAESLLEHLIVVEPVTIAARWSLGRLLARQGRYAEAIQHFEEILKIAPDEYRAHLFLGGLFRHMGDSEAAAEAFRRYARQEQARRLQATARKESEELAKKIFGSIQ